MQGNEKSRIEKLPILECNVGDKRFQETKKLLLYGTCVPDRYSSIFKQFIVGWTPIHACLEALHMDHVGYKLASIIKYSKIEDLTILTIDGSPHCYQLHALGQDIKRHFASDLNVFHYVIEKGEVFSISSQAVSVARHLHRIQKFLNQKGEKIE